MSYFAAAEQTSIAELAAFLQNFLKILRALKINETKIKWLQRDLNLQLLSS